MLFCIFIEIIKLYDQTALYLTAYGNIRCKSHESLIDFFPIIFNQLII